MNCYSSTSLFDFPLNPSEYAQDIHEIEENATKALKNIHLLYNEIMSPKEYSSEADVSNINLRESSSYVCNRQNHYVKSCCSNLRELCAKCNRHIERCASCSRCECRASNDNFKNSGSVKSSENVEYRNTSAQNDNFKLKCTIPKPFSLYEKNEERQKAKEQKIFKMKQELDSKIDSELKIRANCKPVPKSTHLPLYNQMVQEKEKQKVERKVIYSEIINNVKPFNLHSSKRSEKAKSSSDLTSKNTFNFKAKPVPKHILSSKVSEKLKNKEEVRKMLISERAKQTKELSFLPFSNKPVTYSRSLIDLCNLNKTQSKEQSKPKNISEITKRLYIKKCNETINSWNKKVAHVDPNKKIEVMEMQNLLIGDHIALPKKKLNKAEDLPFLYFPVRMSNAAILREKQIRTEILARKEREERKKDEELAKKKTNTGILHKLRNLIPACDGEKEIDDKVKSFRESQIRRKHEYEKELEEIMKRVSEQNLLLERQSKIPRETSTPPSEADNKGSESGDSESEHIASKSDDNELKKSVSTNSSTVDSSPRS